MISPGPTAAPSGGRPTFDAVIFGWAGVLTTRQSPGPAVFNEGPPVLAMATALPAGAAEDPPDPHRVAGRQHHLSPLPLTAGALTALPSAVTLLHRLRSQGIRTALVAPSGGGAAMLPAASVAGLFDVRVEDDDTAGLGTTDPADPGVLLEAARRLGVVPGRVAVVQATDPGLRSAVRGGFGLIIGVDRSGNRSDLLAAGAQVVVADLAMVDLTAPLDRLDRSWCGGASTAGGPWLLRYEGFDPALEGTREALCTLGNGYWATRGAAPETAADSVHYPGTYLAGIYNRLSSDLGGRTVENEHLVNAPNWLPLKFRVAGGDWFHPDGAELLAYRQELDLRRGLLTRTIRFRDPAGRSTRIVSRRLVSQAAPHVAALQTTFEAENWSGPLQVRSSLDGRVANRNVAEYRLLADHHLQAVSGTEIDGETVLLDMVTSQSRLHIAMAARTRVHHDDEQLSPPRRLFTHDPAQVGHEFALTLRQGRPLVVEKVIVVATSRDRAVSSAALAAATRIGRAPDFADLLHAHTLAWAGLWERFEVQVHAGERQGLALNLHTFHVLQTVAAAGVDLDAGVPARGLHGEGYRGHVFWDELFVYPMLTLRRPELTQALLRYRYRRLDEARAAARAAGLEGAMFPWQSGSDGREETPTELYNTRTGQWMPDNSRRQRHVGLAVAYSAWQYYQATADLGFLADQGAELLVEVARLFTSLTSYDAAAGRYDIGGVMGPDEFHDGPPGAPGQGLRNNAYTNVLTSWVLSRAAEAVALLAGHDCDPLWNRLQLRPTEVTRWEQVSRRLRVPFHADGVIGQFDGYEQLTEFDWADYRVRYGNIGRLDLILQAEGDSTNNYRLAKQADVLMLFYLFSAEELRALLDRMGYSLPPADIPRTVEFYLARTSHGSTLSRLVHSWVLARSDRHRSWSLFTQALDSDLADIQGGTTREGVHLGAMAGTVDLMMRCYGGLEIRDDVLWLHPQLPAELPRVAFDLLYRGQPVAVEITPERLRLRLHRCAAAPIRVGINGDVTTLSAGQVHDVPLTAPPPTLAALGAAGP